MKLRADVLSCRIHIASIRIVWRMLHWRNKVGGVYNIVLSQEHLDLDWKVEV